MGEVNLIIERAANEVGINFIGGFSALVQKGMTNGAKNMISVICISI